MSEYQYSAFISYSHRDVAVAKWLHRALESYRTPKAIRSTQGWDGEIGDRLDPVFRDRDELAVGSDLGEAIKVALKNAGSLVVICSTASAGSKWVNEEIREYRRLGRGDRIFCLIVDGDPADTSGSNACVPPALLEDDGAEPLAADIRPGKDGKSSAKIKLIASILGVPYDALRQREQQRRIRRLSQISVAAAVGFMVMAGLAVLAILSRNEAVEQRNLAIERTRTAEQTVEFFTGIFEVADPSVAQGSEITAREVVDRAAATFMDELRDEPNVQAEIGLTLAEVYAALGFFRQSDELLGRLNAIAISADVTRARQSILQGESEFRAGDYQDSIDRFRGAVSQARQDGLGRTTLLSRALFGLGQSLSAVDEFDEAKTVLLEAMAIDMSRGSEGRRDVARDLEALGLNEFYGGELTIARDYIERANAIRIEMEGRDSPSVSDNLNTLASIYYLEGDRQRAIELFRSRLAIDERVLGPNHPDVGSMLNNIGRILVEDGNFSDAQPMLERAVRLIESERGTTHDDIAFVAANLGIAEYGLGRVQSARNAFASAIAAARLHDHRNLGPALAELAALECRAGAVQTGMSYLDDAETAVSDHYSDEPWRLAWIQNIRAECLWRTGDREAARENLNASRPSLAERWDRESYFGQELARRERLVGS